jgi:hydroxybutyrate-dimer hydrolase
MHGKTLYDYFTFANLYEPCASLAPAIAGANSAGLPGITTPNATFAANRCEALANRGLVSGTTSAERGGDALAKMLAYGWEPETQPFLASHYSLAVLSVALTYANAYSKSSVKDALCGYSYGVAPVAGVPPAASAAAAAQIFGTGNGTPATSVIAIINNNSVGGAAVDLQTATSTLGTTLRASVDALKVTGNLRGKPAIIVHGRADTLIPINHTSRPYFALNKANDGSSKLSYIEVTNAQHFDAFIDNAAVPGYDSRLVPLHVYFIRALDAMYNHLKNGAALPPSQVVRTTPRGGTPGAAPAITAANVPAIAATPVAGDAITFGNNTVTIPD